MSQDLDKRPEYQSTMDRLKAARRETKDGVEFWMSRDMYPILGYATFQNFKSVIDRASAALAANGQDVSQHVMPTHKVSDAGNNAEDHYLSRAACSLIAMNGDPSKPEVAAAQAYFVVQTRRMELMDQHVQDSRRLELRDKVSQSFRKISGVAQEVGVQRQALFHDARYQGLYGMSLRSVKEKKGLDQKDNLLDRAGNLELAANDFQMELAADVIAKTSVKGEAAAIAINKQVAQDVRHTMKVRGATMPENLPIEPPISEVKKRLKKQTKEAIKAAKIDLSTERLPPS
jgi:DNA-damage-inducible protein D